MSDDHAVICALQDRLDKLEDDLKDFKKQMTYQLGQVAAKARAKKK